MTNYIPLIDFEELKIRVSAEKVTTIITKDYLFNSNIDKINYKDFIETQIEDLRKKGFSDYNYQVSYRENDIINGNGISIINLKFFKCLELLKLYVRKYPNNIYSYST